MKSTDKEIFEFPVLWAGWDCDCVAWIMERKDGSRYLKMTNHGEEYEAPISDLTWKIDEYETAISKTKQAINLLKYIQWRI